MIWNWRKNVEETAKSTALEAAQNALKKHLPEVVDRVLADAIAEHGETQFFGKNFPRTADISHNAIPFVMLMGKRIHQAHKVAPNQAHKIARASLRDFLDLEKIKYGDPEYYWNVDAAFELADEAMRDA